MCLNNEIHNNYLDELIKNYLDLQFSIGLVPTQVEVLKAMIINDYVLFRHGHRIGATFMLTALSTMLRSINPNISMAVTSVKINQPNFLDLCEKKEFRNCRLKPLNIVSIEEALSGKYDVLLLDEITQLQEKYVQQIITHIKEKTISKIIATCNGYRDYYPIIELEKYMCSTNNTVIVKGYKDMPVGFFDIDVIEKAKTMFDCKKEFDMHYSGDNYA